MKRRIVHSGEQWAFCRYWRQRKPWHAGQLAWIKREGSIEARARE